MAITKKDYSSSFELALQWPLRKPTLRPVSGLSR